MLARLIQTTIATELFDAMITAVFVPDVINPPDSRNFDFLRRYLGIQQVITLPLDAEFFDPVWFAETFFQSSIATSTYLYRHILYSDLIVVEQSPPILTSLFDFLKNASGVAIGAYVGVEAATGS